MRMAANCTEASPAVICMGCLPGSELYGRAAKRVALMCVEGSPAEKYIGVSQRLVGAGPRSGLCLPYQRDRLRNVNHLDLRRLLHTGHRHHCSRRTICMGGLLCSELLQQDRSALASGLVREHRQAPSALSGRTAKPTRQVLSLSVCSGAPRSRSEALPALFKHCQTAPPRGSGSPLERAL